MTHSIVVIEIVIQLSAKYQLLHLLQTLSLTNKPVENFTHPASVNETEGRLSSMRILVVGGGCHWLVSTTQFEIVSLANLHGVWHHSIAHSKIQNRHE